MAFDVHGINFLKFAATRQPFKRTATMGSQWLLVPPGKMHGAMRWHISNDYGGDSDSFLKENFGATTVESFDYSDFEGATHLLDLNKPTDFSQQYDTVIDTGTSEHIYNAPQVFKTMSQLCATGGQIIHVVPANNFCGHGFWQFSPGLFFALYAAENGYAETRVFLADHGDYGYWYETRAATSAAGALYPSSRPLYVMARTRKIRDQVSHDDIQQLEYRHEWKPQGEMGNNAKRIDIKSAIKRAIGNSAAFVPLRSLYWAVSNLSLRYNPHVVRHSVASLVGP